MGQTNQSSGSEPITINSKLQPSLETQRPLLGVQCQVGREGCSRCDSWEAPSKGCPVWDTSQLNGCPQAELADVPGIGKFPGAVVKGATAASVESESEFHLQVGRHSNLQSGRGECQRHLPELIEAEGPIEQDAHLGYPGSEFQVGHHILEWVKIFKDLHHFKLGTQSLRVKVTDLEFGRAWSNHWQPAEGSSIEVGGVGTDKESSHVKTRAKLVLHNSYCLEEQLDFRFGNDSRKYPLGQRGCLWQTEEGD